MARRTTKAKRTPKPRKAKAKPMPDLGDEQSSQAFSDAAIRSQHYELQPPTFPPQEPASEPVAGPVYPPRDDTAPRWDPAPEPLPGADGPLTHVRMVHPDADASIGGCERVAGGFMVPIANVNDMKGHGFKVEHLHERATE